MPVVKKGTCNRKAVDVGTCVSVIRLLGVLAKMPADEGYRAVESDEAHDGGAQGEVQGLRTGLEMLSSRDIWASVDCCWYF